MRSALLIAVALAGLLGAAPASANRMPAPMRVTLHADTPCPFYGGSCSNMETDEIYLDRGADRFDRLHELGHQFDRQVLDDAPRARFVPLLGYKRGTAWSSSDPEAVADHDPSERFADAYAHCGQGTLPSSEVGYGYLPSMRVHHRVCFLIQFVGWYNTR